MLSVKRFAASLAAERAGRAKYVLAILLAVFAAYIALFRAGYYLPGILFWIVVLAIVLSLVWQAVTSQETDKHIWLLAGALIFIWLLKTLFVPVAVPFFGSDPYISFAGARNIESVGWLSAPPWSSGTEIVWANERNYPFLAGVAVAVTKISGMSMETWARWGMVSLSLLSVLLVYGITHSAFGSSTVSLVSAIGFGLTYYDLMFHSLFLRETIAFLLFLTTLYALLQSEVHPTARGKVLYGLIATFSVLGVVLAHHLTALLLFLCLLVYSFASMLPIFARVPRQRILLRWTFAVYVFVIMFTYWIYLQYSPIRIISTLIEEAFQTGAAFSLAHIVPWTWRYVLVLLLQNVSTLILGVLALYGLFKYRALNWQWQLTSVSLGGMLGLFAALGAAGILGKLGSFPSRLEVFGYVFLLPAAIHTIIQIQQHHPIRRLVLAGVIGAYAIASILRMAPYLYSNSTPNWAAGEAMAVLSGQEYDLLTHLQSSSKGLVGISFQRLTKTIGLDALEESSAQGLSLLSTDKLDYLALGVADHYTGSSSFGSVLQPPGLNKVYDAQGAELYVPASQLAWSIDSVITPARSKALEQSRQDPWYEWGAVLAIFVCFSSCGLALLHLFEPDSRSGRNLIGDLALSISLGLELLFAGFLLYDSAGGASVLMFFVPLFVIVIPLGGVYIWRLFHRRKSMPRLRVRYLPSYFFVAVLIIASATFQNVGNSARSAAFTQFYIVSWNECQRRLVVVVANHSAEPLMYHIEGSLNNNYSLSVPSFAVASQGVYTKELVLEEIAAKDQKMLAPLDLKLYDESHALLQQDLRLWIDSRCQPEQLSVELAPEIAWLKQLKISIVANRLVVLNPLH
jgi:hypothetical protein